MKGIKLFQELTFRSVTLKNRIVVSPMGMYSAENGYVMPFHLAHYAKFAMGGAGLVFVEQTAVTRTGRVSNGELGLWEDRQIEGMQQLATLIKSQGAKAAIQIGHGGRKASQQRAFLGNGELTEFDLAIGEEKWLPAGPSAIAFADGWQTPVAMSTDAIRGIVHAFVAAARRALLAGFDIIELHMAHGYLLQSFLTPLANQRTDEYGGTLENRMRLPLEVARAVRSAIPHSTPLFARISATDWIEGGWTIEDSLVLAGKLKAEGVDLIDCSSGGNMQSGATNSNLARGPGYQVEFARRIRAEKGIATGAVGLIRTPEHAERILQEDDADLVFLGRQMLYDPFWALHAAEHFGLTGNFEGWPQQYGWWLHRWARAVRNGDEPLR